MKNKKIYIVFTILLVMFSMSMVTRCMQNDTFFTIPIGKYIVENGGLDNLDHWSFHENLEFTHSGWIFDLIIYYTYLNFGFNGIYIFISIIAAIISLIVFNTLLKEKNNIVLSYILTSVIIYFSSGAFTGRGQLLSFLIFVLEIYALNGLHRTGKKRYTIMLLILPIILANTHDTVWPIYFVIILPYIAEMIWRKIPFLQNPKIIAEENKYGKTLITITIISLFTGLLTPVFGTAYTNMITVMKGVSSEFISELQQVNIYDDIFMLVMLFSIIGIMGFTQTKLKLRDLLYVIGFLIMSLLASRNIFFLYLIGGISFGNIITAFFNEYKANSFFENLTKFFSSNVYLGILAVFIISLSIRNYTSGLETAYVDKTDYPVEVTEWILKNVDIDNMRIYNHFNYGSYLELNGIKVFIDSRSGIYCEEFNDTEVMKDYMDAENGSVNYRDIFNKYNITHALLYNTDIVSQYICYDNDYEKIYQDDSFVLYEKKDI